MITAIIQARMGSTRLPGKVLADLGDGCSLHWMYRAAYAVPSIDRIIIATSDRPTDDKIANWCLDNRVQCYRGSEIDVLDRFMGVAGTHGGDIFVRLTGDCPFIDPRIIEEVIRLRDARDADYATNTNPPTYPDGLDVEVFTLGALQQAHKEATRATDRDCVTRFIIRNSHRFHLANLVCPLPSLVHERWVLDSPEDLEFIREVVGRLPGLVRAPSYLDILSVLDREPYLRKINAKYSRNERFYDALTEDILHAPRTYNNSRAWLKAAEKHIPLGTQTFSKSRLMFPVGASPLFLSHGDGGYCFDVDGNDYVDCVGALLPNILGYRDSDVDAAVRAQLDRGTSFSLATPQELILAKLLSAYIPSAEMVRFGKNGSDVTSAAIRLARHITGKDEIFVGGYHGWHDWSIAQDPIRNNGVPKAVRNLTFKEGESSMQNWAAAIMEPEFLTREQMQKWRKLADDCGFLLIFDEIITGFRFGMGGLQKVHGVTPDLSCFGKSMANGMPISALVGLEKYMKHMPEISYSGTFFGEALSIAAAIATIHKLESENVPVYLEDIGLKLEVGLNRSIANHKIKGIDIYGHASLLRIKYGDKHIQSLFVQEMAKRGVLIINSINTCFAHKEPQIRHILSAFDKTMEAIANGAQLYGEPIKGKPVR